MLLKNNFLFFFVIAVVGGMPLSAVQAQISVPNSQKIRLEKNHFTLPKSLESYLVQIQTHHHAMKFMKARIDIAKESVTQAGLGNNPQIVAQGGYGKTKTTTPNQNFHGSSNSASVTLTQPIYTGGRLEAAKKVAGSSLREETYGTDSDINEFLFEATKAYTEYFKQQALEKLYLQEVDDTLKEVKSIQAELKAGERTATDLAVSTSRHATAKANLAHTQADLDAAIEEFVFYVGTDIPADIANTPIDRALKVDTNFTPPDLAVLYQQNPRIQEMNAAVNTKMAEIDRAKAEYAPSVNLEGQAGYADRYNEFGQVLDNKDYSLMTRYNIPIYNRGLEYSAVRGAVLQESRAKNQLVALSGDVMAKYKANILKYHASAEVVSAYQIALKSADIAAKAAQQEYQYGFRSITELADVKNDVLKAKSDLITAKTERLISLLNILKDINGLQRGK